MTSTKKASFSKVVKDITERREKHLVAHPDVEILADYQDKLLPRQEAEVIAEHLSVCRSCTQTLLSMYESPQEETATVKNTPPSQTIGRILRPGFGLLSPSHMAWATAASLLLALLATGWGISQNRELNRLGKPGTQVWIGQLYPTGEANLKGSRSETPQLPADTQELLFFLNPGVDLSHKEYSIRILDHNRTFWQSEMMPPPEDEVFPLKIPVGFLRKKTYSVILVAYTKGNEEILAHFEIDLR